MHQAHLGVVQQTSAADDGGEDEESSSPDGSSMKVRSVKVCLLTVFCCVGINHFRLQSSGQLLKEPCSLGQVYRNLGINTGLKLALANFCDGYTKALMLTGCLSLRHLRAWISWGFHSFTIIIYRTRITHKCCLKYF